MIHLYMVLADIKPAFVCSVPHRRVNIRENRLCVPYCPVGIDSGWAVARVLQQDTWWAAFSYGWTSAGILLFCLCINHVPHTATTRLAAGAITASIAASSVSSDLKHVEKHGFAIILLIYENVECWLQKEFDEADVLALPLIQKRSSCKRWNSTQTALLQSQRGPQLLAHLKCVNRSGKAWIQLGVYSCAKHLLA